MTNTLSGRWGIDSNLLIYSQDVKSPFHQATREVFKLVKIGQIEAVIAQQNIVECERVLVYVYKLTVKRAISDLTEIITAFKFEVVTPLSTTYLSFQTHIRNSPHKLPDFFDYYLAATLMDNGVNRLLTGNTSDFADIKGFTAVNPFK